MVDVVVLRWSGARW